MAYDLQSGKLMKAVYQNLSLYPPYSFASVVASGFPKVVCGSVSNTDLFRFVDGQDPPVDVPAERSRDAAAVVLHIIDNAVVGGDSGRSDITTWVKIRSIHSTVD